MVKRILFIALCISLVSCSSKSKDAVALELNLVSKLEDGDIIFQSTQSRQCEAVKLATKSKYSHVGIVFKDAGKWMVYEAVQPVKKTPLNEWISHGKNNHYVVKRLKNASETLSKEITQKMKEIGESDMGKNYDIYFNWSDDEIYCSELVWKIYDEGAGIHIGELKQLKDFDLTRPSVRQIMAERYGTNIPLNERVVAPSDLFDSEKLILVDQN